MRLSNERADPRVVFDARALQDIAENEAPLVGRVIVAGGLTLIRGEVGLGKSWLALSLAQAAAGGHALFGWKASRAVPRAPCRWRLAATGAGGAGPDRRRRHRRVRAAQPAGHRLVACAAARSRQRGRARGTRRDAAGGARPAGARRRGGAAGGGARGDAARAAPGGVDRGAAAARRRRAAHRRAAPRGDGGAGRARRHGAGARAALRLRARRGRARLLALRRRARDVGAGGAAVRGAAGDTPGCGAVGEGRSVRRGGGAGGGAAPGRAVLPRHRAPHGRALDHRVPPAAADRGRRDRHGARNSGTARAGHGLT